MVTSKSFTDLSQSKALSKILPLKSADACWTNHLFNNILSTLRIESTPPTEYKTLLDNYYVQGYLIEPAWSLTALLNILPTLNDRNAVFCKDIRCDKWHVFYHGTATLPLIDTKRYHNIIDASVAMILKLHELKLL